MKIQCPKCGNDQAYHNGVNYECPDCDYEWSDGVTYEDSDDWEEE